MSNTPANNVAYFVFAIALFAMLTVGNGILVAFILHHSVGG
jgi:hypothetical protein